MRFTAQALFALAATSFVAATKDKANEYQSTDCSGSINYSHNPAITTLTDVTMADNTNSVYLTFGYSKGADGFPAKSSNGGSCEGTNLGAMNSGCNNLFAKDTKVECVRFYE